MCSLGELARLVGGDLEGDPALETGVASSTAPARGPVVRRLHARTSRAPGKAPPPRADRAPRSGPPDGRRSGRAALAAVAAVLRCLSEPVVAPGVHPRDARRGQRPDLAGRDICSAFAVVARPAPSSKARVVLHADVYVGDDAVIGDDCVLFPHVVVRERRHARQPRRSSTPAASSAPTASATAGTGGGTRRSRRSARSSIEDDVEIGSCVCVDRAKFGETRIGRGTKIDNLVQVGHNVQIGPHCIIVGQVGIAGSVTLGGRRRARRAGRRRDHVTIGDGAQIGSESGVSPGRAGGRRRDRDAGRCGGGRAPRAGRHRAPSGPPAGRAGAGAAYGRLERRLPGRRKGRRPWVSGRRDPSDGAGEDPGAQVGPGTRTSGRSPSSATACVSGRTSRSSTTRCSRAGWRSARGARSRRRRDRVPPQGLKWTPGTPSGVRIGEETVIREVRHASPRVHSDGFTVMGKDCYLWPRVTSPTTARSATT